ncbi:DUF2867 domain-containing protein [Marinomonas sp. THO17]|uniref:DUF2867 domain-containing protein n=1 Tax=Marinomonas sp. THO17 TaxID=3149048 RepID=UPI00336C067F
MAQVTTHSLPIDSELRRYVKQEDFIDCYAIESDLPPRRAAEIITNFPAWARLLVKIRNAMTAPFGLLKEGPQSADKVGFFPLELDTAQEVIAGFNDTHLNFRVSIMALDGRIYLATWVHPHNKLGKYYLKTILPFHNLIVHNALRRVHKASF